MAVTKLPTTKKNAFVSMMEIAEEYKATNLVDPMSGLPCPDELINLVDKYMRAGNNDLSPSEGVWSLREQIVSIFNRQNNTDLQTETDLTISAGPAQAMSTAITTFVKEGDVVILDNLSSHKSPKAEAILKQRGAWFLFLPPYSPDLNPIEQVFAKLKALLRKEAARTVGALWDAVGKLIHRYCPSECANYFANDGYRLTNRDTL